MSIQELDTTENYDDGIPLTEAMLHAVSTSIEDWAADLILDIYQMKRDVLGPDVDYDFNQDGNPILATPLIDLVAQLDENETITGSWTFEDSVAFEDSVSSTSTFSSSGQPRTRVYRGTSNQAIANATATAVAFNSESYDTGAMHDTGLNTSRITIPTGGSGTYLFDGQVVFDNNNTGRRELYLYKNGVEVARTQLFNPDATLDSYVRINFQDTASAGDYYELFVYQNSTGSLDIVFGAALTFFASMKVW